MKRSILSLVLGLVSGLALASPDYWIDVRTSAEFNTGHVAAAINIPYERIGERIAEVTTNKNAEIFLSCQSGRRSAIALETLRALGYTNVRNVGGIADALKLEQRPR